MTPELTQVSHAAALRALAHPLRQRLYEQLVLFGPLTATDLAARVDDTPSNCSWHLRKLAEHGFVEEDPAGAAGRRRPWRASVRGMVWGDDADHADGADAPDADELRRAGDALTRSMIERELERLNDAWARLPGDTRDWNAAASATQSMLWLTADELAEANAAVREILLRTRDRHDHPELRPAGARLCAFLAWGVPTYGLAEPTPQADRAPGEH